MCSNFADKILYVFPLKKKKSIKTYHVTGVPIVAQWLMNPSRNHEVEGSIPGLAQ